MNVGEVDEEPRAHEFLQLPRRDAVVVRPVATSQQEGILQKASAVDAFGCRGDDLPTVQMCQSSIEASVEAFDRDRRKPEWITMILRCAIFYKEGQ